MSDQPLPDLYACFLPAVQAAAEVGGNHILTRLSMLVRELDQLNDSFIRRSKADLSNLLKTPNMTLDGNRTQQFVQQLAETHFYIVCKTRGIDLTPVETVNNTQTPDFRTNTEPVAHFEI